MNNRERLLAVLQGRRPDRIPWIPRLELWYNAHARSGTLPARWAGRSLREIERGLGAGTPALSGRIYRVEHEDVEIVTHQEGMLTITEYQTPVGTVREVRAHSDELREQGLPGVLRERVLKGPEDYAVWEWVVEHRRYVPTYEAFQGYDADIGDDGLPLVLADDNPFYHFLEVLVGFQHAYYHLMDYRDEVEHLLAVMTGVQRERLWSVIANSPAQLIMNGYHLSSQLTPPYLFERYILPYYEESIPYLHEHGKWAVMHADADVSLILELIERAGWDMVDCLVTAPMVPLTLAQARQAWGERVIISGGLPAVLLQSEVSEEDFQAYVGELFRVIAPGDAFVLGVADNVMPNSLIDRVVWVSEQIERRGWYPITP
jgi:hypothetical protein